MDGDDSSRGWNRLIDVAPTLQQTNGEGKVYMQHIPQGSTCCEYRTELQVQGLVVSTELNYTYRA